MTAALNQLAQNLEQCRGDLLTSQREVLSADGGNMFPLDLLFMGAANRSLANIDGFLSLHEQKNFLCS